MVIRKRYTIKFKKEAVRLVLMEHHSASDVERRLGTGKGVVARWVRELAAEVEKPKAQSIEGNGRDLEIKTLREALARVRRERDRLKKALRLLLNGKADTNAQ